MNTKINLNKIKCEDMHWIKSPGIVCSRICYKMWGIYCRPRL